MSHKQPVCLYCQFYHPLRGQCVKKMKDVTGRESVCSDYAGVKGAPSPTAADRGWDFGRSVA
jgi:hypothetical protein